MFDTKLVIKISLLFFSLLFIIFLFFLLEFLIKITLNYNNDSITTRDGFVCGEDYMDSRDDQKYPTIKIGGQCWITKNINYVTENSWCYDNNPLMCNKYGRIYNWYAATGACPPGWNLPTYNDWLFLEYFIAGDNPCHNFSLKWRCSPVGERMKTLEWGGNNQSGFTALPGGHLYIDNNFYGEGVMGCFWSSSDVETRAWNRYLHRDLDHIARGCDPKLGGGSVRCFKPL